MKQNTFISFGILALLVLALNVVSANLVASPITLNATQGFSNSTSFTIYNNDSVNSVNLTDATLAHNNFPGSQLSTNFTSQNLANNTSVSFSISLNADKVGTFIDSLTIFTNTSTLVIPITLQVSAVPVTTSTFNDTLICGKLSNASIYNIELKDNSNLDDDWSWKPLDNVEIKVYFDTEFDNDESYDYSVDLVFYRQVNGVWKDMSEEVADDTDLLQADINNLDGGDDADVVFNFKVNGDIKDENYYMVAKVVQDETGKACNWGEKSAGQEISIDKKSQQIVINNLEAPVTASCGETIQLTAEVANIGDSDEDRVKVNLYNKDLGINTFREIENLDSGESQDVSFMFTVPTTAIQKIYSLVLSTEYGYNDNKDRYDDSDSDDDYTYKLNLIDGCVDPTKPTITAALDSSAQVGKDFNITITIKNNANSSNSFLLTAEGYDAWASSASFVPTAFNLAKQATQTVTLTLSPTQSGAKTFTLKTVYNGKTVEQVVGLNIASKKETAISNYFANMKDGNVTTWLVTGIVILIVLILIILLLRLLL